MQVDSGRVIHCRAPTFIPVRLSVVAQIDMPGFQACLNGYHGLLQRVAAAAVFGPVALAAWLLRRFGREQGAVVG
jgi:hypothetical protein